MDKRDRTASTRRLRAGFGLALLAGLPLLLAACASQGTRSRQDGDSGNYDGARAACRDQSISIEDQAQRDQVFDACMKAQGWYKH